MASDVGGPGGFTLKGGLNSLLQKIADGVGRDNIILNSPVATLLNETGGVELADGTRITSKEVIYTGSIALLKNEKIAFENLKPETREIFDQFNTAHLTKVFYELPENYLLENPEQLNRYTRILDGNPPFLCHISNTYKENGDAQPVLMFMFGGDAAKQVETMPASAITDFVKQRLCGVEDLKNFPGNTIGDPHVTGFNKGAFTGCAYSAYKPGYKAPEGPVNDGLVTICGEAFPPKDKNISVGYAGGALLSGQRAADMVMGKVQKPALLENADSIRNLESMRSIANHKSLQI